MGEILKLKAFDEDGLTIISSLCQDSIISQSEYGYDKKSKRFAIIMNRFCYEEKESFRIKSAIHFDYVESLKIKNIKTIIWIIIFKSIKNFILKKMYN